MQFNAFPTLKRTCSEVCGCYDYWCVCTSVEDNVMMVVVVIMVIVNVERLVKV